VICRDIERGLYADELASLHGQEQRVVLEVLHRTLSAVTDALGKAA